MHNPDGHNYSKRVFVRLSLPVKPGDVVTLDDGRRALVETAKIADDLRDAKCVVLLQISTDIERPTDADVRRAPGHGWG